MLSKKGMTMHLLFTTTLKPTSSNPINNAYTTPDYQFTSSFTLPFLSTEEVLYHFFPSGSWSNKLESMLDSQQESNVLENIQCQAGQTANITSLNHIYPELLIQRKKKNLVENLGDGYYMKLKCEPGV